MNKYVFIIVLAFISAHVFASGSRQYEPVSPLEDTFYRAADKNVWPDDIRENIDLYRNTLIAWAGIVEMYMTDTSSGEFNIIGFYIKHHYYDWIEAFGEDNKPVRLSYNGEGYFVVYYMANKDADIDELTDGITGDCLINYGYPLEVTEDGVIIMTNEYLRHIPKVFVSQNRLDYGRNWGIIHD